MFLQAYQISLHRVLDVRNRLGSRLALRNAAGQRRALRNKYPIFVDFNHYAINHRSILSFVLSHVNAAITPAPSPAPPSPSPHSPSTAHQTPQSSPQSPAAAATHSSPPPASSA